MEDLLSDPTGVQEFTNYLQKEKSEENILFWLAVNDLRRSSQSQVLWKVQEIYEYVIFSAGVHNSFKFNFKEITLNTVHPEK